jgi:ABC-type multidrug transport system fused ATPase/permease subunit
MSTMIEFEEEEFTTQFNGQTIVRILQQLRPYWKWVLGFLAAVAVVSFLESYFTYLSKRIIDEGIVAGNVDALWHLLTNLWQPDIASGRRSLCLYLCNRIVGRTCALRSAAHHVQSLTAAFTLVL